MQTWTRLLDRRFPPFIEIILTIAVKTLSNYSNHVFHTEVDERFRDFTWTPAA